MQLLSPIQLSEELRTARSPHLRRRRWTLGLSLLGVAGGSIVGLYQMGILKRLPDIPSKYFNATKVDASEYGYKFLQSPDALLMIANYAVTAILTGAGGKERARDLPAVPIALAGKTFYDLLTNLFLAKEEWKYNKAFCGYCQSATIASLISFLFSLPEAREAVRNLRGEIQESSDTRGDSQVSRDEYDYEQGFEYAHV